MRSGGLKKNSWKYLKSLRTKLSEWLRHMVKIGQTRIITEIF